VRTRAAAWDTPAHVLILFLAFGVPLAMGTVTVPSILAFEWLVLVLVLYWIVRSVWLPPAYVDVPTGNDAAGSGGRRSLRLFGHPLARTRVGVPVALFILLVLLQLVPFPPALIRLLSPSTARLYGESLPGYGTSEGVDFANFGSFLLGPGSEAVPDRILTAPGDLPVDLDARGASLRTLSIYPYATVRQLFVFLALLGLFLVTANAFRSHRKILLALRATVLFGFAYALFGIVQRLSWNGKIFWFVPVVPEASPFGSFVNHNHFAALLAMIVPIATGMLMDEARQLVPRGGDARLRGRGRTPGIFAAHGPEPFARLLLAAFVVGVMIGAIVLSASRGAVLALAGGFVFYGGALVVQGRIGRTEAAVGALLIFLAVAISAWLGIGPLAEKIYAIGNVETEPSLLSRVVGWQWTVRIIGDFPLFGTGLGTFPQAWTRYYPPGTAVVWLEAHNDYLQLLSETGVIGFVIFAAAFGIFVWRYILPGILRSTGSDTYVIHGVALGITAIALHSIVDFPLQINGCAAMFVVLAGLLVAYRNRLEAAA
jgi:O-antigen ligase